VHGLSGVPARRQVLLATRLERAYLRVVQSRDFRRYNRDSAAARTEATSLELLSARARTRIVPPYRRTQIWLRQRDAHHHLGWAANGVHAAVCLLFNRNSSERATFDATGR